VGSLLRLSMMLLARIFLSVVLLLKTVLELPFSRCAMATWLTDVVYSLSFAT
jgi:hypothetical protein